MRKRDIAFLYSFINPIIHNVRFYLSYDIYIINLKLHFWPQFAIYIIIGIVIARRYFITLPNSIFH